MKKKVLSVLLCAAMILSLTACGGNSTGGTTGGGTEEGGQKPTETAKLPILGAGIYSASDNFNSYIGKSIVNASGGIFKTNIEDGQNDQSTQTNQVDTMIAKGAKVIALSVCDTTAAPALIEKVKAAGNLPIIFFNKEITEKGVIDSYENAYQVTSTGGDYGAAIEGQMIVDAWKANPNMDKNGDGKLQMVNLMGDPGHTASQPRADYVKSTIKDAGIDIDLLAEDTGMWVTATAKDKMDAWISKYGDEIECIVAANDAMALGALTSIEAAGYNTNGTESKKYIPIIGIDALPEMLDKIESGEVMGSVLQDAKTQGQIIVKMAENLINGKDASDGMDFKLDEAKAIRVPYKAITKDNLDVAKSTYAK
ncbi:monosaccharide ABC transporter substrate-binding protein, CUT2 family [Anaerocolumna jejuensis DSM 15929]|uniref:D-galactose/methyl-galactoside binding periplasmic protein MglB n=1 Tax=Anaerocolumna jejuensis DSM 15929 TaxID=1121322 RepID=A0A1M6Q1G8_9FIRM|nr:galactose ABC transporter substrate-binding protein [Anaerocolumna jejuensis]SHK13971.1 monosaccharide ABC transporter substrate-binding protein, CUT2 family [Anaerocolumna jejuensis DSM 15929]